jgi:hypothetical protein
MIHRTAEDWKKFPLILIVDEDHMQVIRDHAWMGINVYAIRDLDLLVEWWNQAIRYAGDQLTREIKDKKLQRFHSALWIRVNMLHPKHFLKFTDITIPELMKKV